jgi:mannose-6-phosphate isomerase-like protein (cupin superfamily)
MQRFHHRKLPDYSTLLSGRLPPNDIGFQSKRLQIWYSNNPTTTWRDPAPHLHTESDECFIVLRGSLLVEVEGERFTVGPREFCCFPRGVLHMIVEVHPPYETLMIRAPSVEDKQYRAESHGDLRESR